MEIPGALSTVGEGSTRRPNSRAKL